MNRRAFIKSLGLTAAAVSFGGIPALASETPKLPGATGKTIETTGWTTDPLDEPLRRGDVFSIAGVFAINPITRQATTHLQQFVITADVTGDDVQCHPYRPLPTKRRDVMPTGPWRNKK